MNDDDKSTHNGHANGHDKKFVWDVKKEEDSESKTEITPKSFPTQSELAKPVPGNEDMMITPSGAVVAKYKLDNLKRGNNEGNAGPGKKKLPDLEEALIKVLSEEKNGKQAIDAILEAMRSKATRGGERAAELLLTRAYGAAMLRLEDQAFIPVEPITGFVIEIVDDVKDQDIKINEASTQTQQEARASD